MGADLDLEPEGNARRGLTHRPPKRRGPIARGRPPRGPRPRLLPRAPPQPLINKLLPTYTVSCLHAERLTFGAVSNWVFLA